MERTAKCFEMYSTGLIFARLTPLPDLEISFEEGKVVQYREHSLTSKHCCSRSSLARIKLEQAGRSLVVAVHLICFVHILRDCIGPFHHASKEARDGCAAQGEHDQSLAVHLLLDIVHFLLNVVLQLRDLFLHLVKERLVLGTLLG